MANKSYDDSDGVWRTIGGRRVFIRNGQSLSDAMIESGKFKNLRSDYKKAKEDDEYELYKKARENEDSIDPMTENSTDWEQLDKKYKERYEKENKSFEENKTSGQKTADLIKENNIKTFGDEIEEKERLDIAKDIAKEVYGLNENNASNERIEKEARKILEFSDGEVLDKDDTPFTNSKGQLERSTKSLEEWRDSLKKDTNKYASAKHIGFGDYNKDGIPVYNNKIDYTGDFRNSDLSTLNDNELKEAYKVQLEKQQEAYAENIGDQRTRNGKMNKIFNTARKQQYEGGVNAIDKEIQKIQQFYLESK